MNNHLLYAAIAENVTFLISFRYVIMYQKNHTKNIWEKENHIKFS